MVEGFRKDPFTRLIIGLVMALALAGIAFNLISSAIPAYGQGGVRVMMGGHVKMASYGFDLGSEIAVILDLISKLMFLSLTISLLVGLVLGLKKLVHWGKNTGLTSESTASDTSRCAKCSSLVSPEFRFCPICKHDLKPICTVAKML